MSETVRLFVGYDSEQPLASAVFAHSVVRRSSLPVSVHYLRLGGMTGIFNRPRDPYQSTEFAFTRFLVPHLCDHDGWAIFADGDMICRGDIAELWDMRDARHVVQVVKRARHEMTPNGKKFLGRAQTAYPMKNWSSLMLINCSMCARLTPEYVARAPGLDLHQFAWVSFPEDIGALPAEWNHLVGVDQHDPQAKLVHYTLGMPFFNGLRECEFAPEWREERDALLAHVGGPVPAVEIGNTVTANA
jgi:hypothetical protein